MKCLKRKVIRRRGAILALVLVSMIAATTLGLALTRSVLMHHRHMHSLADRQQAFWLAETGLQRAARALSVSNDYSGETWNVPEDALGDRYSAVVAIEVGEEPAGDHRQIVATVRLQRDSGEECVYRREKTFDGGGSDAN